MNELTIEAKSLNHVFKNSGLSQRAFGALFDLSHVTIGRMISGDTPVSLHVFKTACNKLGYSPAWFITGRGPEKEALDISVTNKTTLITEIQSLRTEMDIINKLNQHLLGRLLTYERSFKELESFVHRKLDLNQPTEDTKSESLLGLNKAG